MGRPITDLTNIRSGKLVAAWPVGYDKHEHSYWMCFCDCGNYLPVRGNLVISKMTQSCGCIPVGIKSDFSSIPRKSRTPEYMALKGAIQRCYNPSLACYKDYGGRGIEVHASWRGPRGFDNFLVEVGPKPEPRHLYSLDRINNDGNYEPGNCKWATKDEQSANRRVKRIENFSDTEIIKEFVRRNLKLPGNA